MIKSSVMPNHRSQRKCYKATENTDSFSSLRLSSERSPVTNQSIIIDETGSPSDGVIPNWLSVVDTPTRRI
ncbi:hypothetical protein EXT64_19690 [Pectobacterium atrosepticum]|nr:hypothetical protein [Pectobacterium atrosepticum]PWD70159.1 hypothetical protein DF215_09770 [Pectobacterium versatile]TAI96121.1 hypothetical protein EG335_13230 [Pectobacterium versatile]